LIWKGYTPRSGVIDVFLCHRETPNVQNKGKRFLVDPLISGKERIGYFTLAFSLQNYTPIGDMGSFFSPLLGLPKSSKKTSKKYPTWIWRRDFLTFPLTPILSKVTEKMKRKRGYEMKMCEENTRPVDR
jgi:hypothetical protein